jgi:hypothetical protein
MLLTLAKRKKIVTYSCFSYNRVNMLSFRIFKIMFRVKLCLHFLKDTLFENAWKLIKINKSVLFRGLRKYIHVMVFSLNIRLPEGKITEFGIRDRVLAKQLYSETQLNMPYNLYCE